MAATPSPNEQSPHPLPVQVALRDNNSQVSQTVLNTSSATETGYPISELHRICRIFGLESFYLMFRQTPQHAVIEEKKKPIDTSLSTAFYTSAFHSVPIMASITLIILNFRGYYVGGELTGPINQDDLKFLALQVAAKLIELIIVASLSLIVFALLRDHLLAGNLPFGAVTAGFEFSKISFLWSKEFIATCGGEFASTWFKALVLLTIIVFTIMSVLVGPAAAVAGQPALSNWPAGGSYFSLNTTEDTLFPLTLDVVPVGHEVCSLNRSSKCYPLNHRLLADQILSYWPMGQDQFKMMPENALVSSFHALRSLATRFRGPFVFQPSLSTATVPMSAIADALAAISGHWTLANLNKSHGNKGGFLHYKDIFFSIDTLQPIAYVACLPSAVESILEFPNIDPLQSDPKSRAHQDSTLGTRAWFHKATLNGTITALTWTDLPRLDASIGAIVSLPGSNASNIPDQILACTIDARWANATITGSFWKGPRVVSGLPVEWFGSGRHLTQRDGRLTWSRIHMSSEWAAHLDPKVDALNISTFGFLANSVGRANDITKASWVQHATEAILAVMIADSLSHIASGATVQGNLKAAWRDELLPTQVYGKGGSAFDYVSAPDDQLVQLRMLVEVNGYGYGLTTATLLSCLLLLVYCFIAVVFVAYRIWLRETSDSWASISELLALAINSRPPATLRNTGAGIHSLRTLKEHVSIGCEDGRLELIFENSADGRRWEKGGPERVQGGGFYG